ncbi:hypothetical protein CRM22_003308 [Opisthorchis felineus]|uniref:Uncharacterized protein n=1 Tax=Opisthorchis felineus TaxID=147828 RepID=A0A4S2M1X8_OPIFE|nr:hypothetical protein CRM22_003308 [Opisthorchis felineus]TGZ70241.1 hypothetical protein CRM22_003308 [Opisthorchis felineus]
MSESEETNSGDFEFVFTELVHCVDDPDEAVRIAVQASLIQLSTKDPGKVLRYLHCILRQHANETTASNRINIFLNIVDTILNGNQDNLQHFKACRGLIKTVSRFLDQQKWQAVPAVVDHASSILVNLSSAFCREVVEHLLTVVSTEKHTAHGVIETAGRIASQHSHDIMHLLPVLLSQIMNYMTQPTIDDTVRTSLANTLGQYCEAALEYLASAQDALDTWDVVLELISSSCSSVVDTMLSVWLNGTKDSKLIQAIFYNIGSIASLTDLTYLVEHLPRLINSLTGQLKKSHPPLEQAVVHSLNALFATVARRCSVLKLNHSHSKDSISSTPLGSASPGDQITKFFEGELDSLMNCLLNQLVQMSQRQLVAEVPGAVSVTQKTMNEVKRALASLCTAYPVRVLSFTEAHLHSGSDLSRSVSVNLLRHLVSSCDGLCFDDAMRKSILANLIRLLFQSMASPNPIRRGSMKHNLMGAVVKASPVSRDRCSMMIGEVASGDRLPSCIRYELVKIVLTLGSLDYFKLDSGTHVFVEYVVRQCGSPLTRTTDMKANRNSPSQETIRSLCVHVLKLSSTTVPSMYPTLWPFLLEFLMVQDCTEAVGVVCDSIANILSKSLTDFDPWKFLSSPSHLTDGSPGNADSKLTSVPAPCTLLARLAVLLSRPLHGKGRGLPILRVLRCMARYFHQSLPTLWDAVIPHMLLYLNQDQDLSDDASGTDKDIGLRKPQRYHQSHWEGLTLKLLSKSIDLVEDDKWTLALLRSFENQMPFYESMVEEKSFLFQCITMTLCKLDMDHVIAESLELVFRSTNHGIPLEQEGCVVALGRIAATHNHVLFNFLYNEQVKLDSYVRSSAPSTTNSTPSSIAKLSKSSGSTISVVIPTGSPNRRLSNLFRSTVSIKASSPPSPGEDRPLPHDFRGSVEQARATVIWTYASAMDKMSLDAFSSCVDTVLKTVILPVVQQMDGVLCLQATVTELCSSIARTFRKHLADTPESSLINLSGTIHDDLLQSVVGILGHELSISQSAAISTLRPKGDSTPPLCIQLRYALLVTALDVTLLGNDRKTSQVTELLQSSAAAILPVLVNSGVTVLDYSEAILSSMESKQSAFTSAERLSPAQLFQDSDSSLWHSRCLTSLHHLWTVLLRLQCSEELISEMCKVLVPYLYDPSFVVNVRAVCLLISILATILSELQLVNKNACAPPILGQLVGHLVTSLGNSTDYTLRRPSKVALQLLLRVQNLFLLTDPEMTEPAISHNEVATKSQEKDGLDTGIKSANVLICEVAYSFPKTQLNALVEFVTNSIANAPKNLDGLQRSHRGSDDDSDDQEASEEADSDYFVTRECSGPEDRRSPPGIFSLKRLRKPHDTKYHQDMIRTSPVSEACVELRTLYRQLNLPRTRQGYLIRLLCAILYHWVGELDEDHVGGLLRTIHCVYPHLSQSEVRAGLLHATAELGRRWPLLCLRVISAGPLPLDKVWCTLLASIAFLPVPVNSSSNISSAFSLNATLPEEHRSEHLPTSLSSTVLFPKLLMHVLKMLECCHPYERREIPADAFTAADRRWLLCVSDKPLLKEANFATHLWLSLVNCLQVLSFPRCMAELIRENTDPNESDESPVAPLHKPTTKQRSTLFRRSMSSPESVIVTPRHYTPCSSPLVHLFGDPQLFSLLLGQWLLACATAAICRTLTGKSYETRSGAEANLKQGVRPLTIAMRGLRQFLRACNCTYLEHCLTLSWDASGGTSESRVSSESSSPWDPGEGLLKMVDDIVRYVVQEFQPEYTSSLIQFFSNHVTSTYDVRRLISTKVLTTILTHLDELGPAACSEPSLNPINLDLLLDHILRRMKDTNKAVRQVVVAAFATIGSEEALKNVSDGNPCFLLIRRNATKIIQGLLSVMDDLSKETDNPILLSALLSLSTIVSLASDCQLGSLLADLCLCLLPVYSSSCAPVRAAAFRLFGIVMQFAWEPSSDQNTGLRPSSQFDALSAEANSVFISMTLHLGDPDENVVQVCKIALKQIGLVLFGAANLPIEQLHHPDLVSCSKPGNGSRRLFEFLQTCLRPNVRLHLGEFYNDLARLLVSLLPDHVADYAMRSTVYLNSDFDEVQCSALLFTSSLIFHSTDEIRANFPLAQVCKDLTLGLRSGNPVVRATSAHALSRLYRV